MVLIFWYASQSLFIRWGSSTSAQFRMANGIRQGSILSPVLFNLYIDELSLKLGVSNVGCHVAGINVNHLIYADDIVVMAPSAKALNELLRVCEVFAGEHQIIFSPVKSVVMAVPPHGVAHGSLPNIYIGGNCLVYVSEFKYLGHFITCEFKDELDIGREVRSLYARGNKLIRKFGSLSADVKCSLFKTFCYSFYCGSLWTTFRVANLYRLKVAYNCVMRKLMQVPPWQSARAMFVAAGVRCFEENLRYVSYNLFSRVGESRNTLLLTLGGSDASLVSRQRRRWRSLLVIPII